MPIKIHQGSILDCDVDVIVNPANSHLHHDGGLARIIANAATGLSDGFLSEASDAWDAEQRDHPLIPTGGVGWTSAGALGYQGIVHAVGPVWGGGGYYERALLRRAHQSACALAWKRGCRSIAFPAISCGIFGFPVEKAAPVAVGGVGDFWSLDQPNGVGMKIVFALFEQAHVDAYQAALEKRFRAAVNAGRVTNVTHAAPPML